MFTIALSDSEASIQSCVDSLGKLFAIVLALAIGEAFKQFVADKADKPEDRKIHWNRIWALGAFISLVVPFFHGMARYFFETYQSESERPIPYQLYLIIDVCAFTVEAVLFFVLSRSLDPAQWRTFYTTVCVLLGIDIVWGLWTLVSHEPSIWPWVVVNAVSAATIFAIVRRSQVAAYKWCMVILVVRMVADYWSTFDVYFPPPDQSQPAVASEAPAVHKPIVYIASPYSKGDRAINTHFQCKTFDDLMTKGKVWPVAPLWSHFQHTMFPRQYQDWIDYDLALLERFDACLRLPAEFKPLKYIENESSGADREAAKFRQLGKPVFGSIDELYAWVDAGMPAPQTAPAATQASQPSKPPAGAAP